MTSRYKKTALLGLLWLYPSFITALRDWDEFEGYDIYARDIFEDDNDLYDLYSRYIDVDDIEDLQYHRRVVKGSGTGTDSEGSSTALHRLATDYTHWKKAGPGDSRSPCPGLNSLAHHNFIPHNGKDITVELIVNAGTKYLGIGKDLITALAVAGLASTGKVTSGKFDLLDLVKHGPIEHDASLSRKDHAQDPSQKFSPEIWQETMHAFGSSSTITLKDAANARTIRVASSSKTNGGKTLELKAFINSNAETALYLAALGDGTSAPKKYVDIMFREERLPYKEGWRPSSSPVTIATTLKNVPKIIQASSHDTTEGMSVSEKMIQNAIAGAEDVKAGASGMVASLWKKYGIV